MVKEREAEGGMLYLKSASQKQKLLIAGYLRWGGGLKYVEKLWIQTCYTLAIFVQKCKLVYHKFSIFTDLWESISLLPPIQGNL